MGNGLRKIRNRPATHLKLGQVETYTRTSLLNKQKKKTRLAYDKSLVIIKNKPMNALGKNKGKQLTTTRYIKLKSIDLEKKNKGMFTFCDMLIANGKKCRKYS